LVLATTLCIVVRPEGFIGERLVVAPRPAVEAALERPVTRRLTVTDAGHFPLAEDHLVQRSEGIPEHVIIFNARGVGWVRFGSEFHHIPARHVLVIPAGVPHEYGANLEEPWTIWWMHVRGADAPELVAMMGVTASRPTIELRTPERAVVLLDEIVTALERPPSPANAYAASGAAWNLMTQIISDKLEPRRGVPLQRAIQFVEARIDSPISVREVAELVGVSTSHLTTLFHKATGGGVLAYQTALRMSRARQLLDTTAESIGNIAQECGYGDAFYFSRIFRRHHGMSPTEYRNRFS